MSSSSGNISSMWKRIIADMKKAAFGSRKQNWRSVQDVEDNKHHWCSMMNWRALIIITKVTFITSIVIVIVINVDKISHDNNRVNKHHQWLQVITTAMTISKTYLTTLQQCDHSSSGSNINGRIVIKHITRRWVITIMEMRVWETAMWHLQW